MSEISTDRRFARWFAALAALALLAGACGGDDEPSEDAGADVVEPADETDGDDDTTATDDGSDDVDADEPTATIEEGAALGPDDEEPADEPEATTTTSAAPTTTASTATTTTLPAESGLPPEEERGQNEAGVRIDLDETATLTCANAEFARDALRQSLLDDALQYTAAAADRAEPSAVVELAELVPEMRAAQTEAEIEAVIDEALVICVDRGHQI